MKSSSISAKAIFNAGLWLNVWPAFTILHRRQVRRFMVYGSFITDKPAPNDVDVFMVMEDTFDLYQLSDEAAIIFDHMACQNYEGASVFWVRKMAAIGGEQAAVEFWQTKRDDTTRGIVEVTSRD
ncbi:MAG: hypothetical protein SF097_08035 [Acidobacteriota bacterium]|nr:hypothetical protein [Acidobacteriota bacterium]